MPGSTGGRADGAYLIRRAMSIAVVAAACDAAIDGTGARSPVTLLDIGGRGRPYAGPIASGLLARSMPVRHLVVDLAPGADIVGAAESLPFSDHSADIVLSTQMLEHVADPARAVSEMARVVKPDGTCLLTTHGTWFYHPDPEDYWRWTPAGLETLFARAGFGEVTVSPVGGTRLALAVLLLTTIQRSTGDGPAGALTRRLMVAPANFLAERWLMRGIPRRRCVEGELVINYLVTARLRRSGACPSASIQSLKETTP